MNEPLLMHEHANVVAHRQRMADRIDAEEAAAAQTPALPVKTLKTSMWLRLMGLAT